VSANFPTWPDGTRKSQSNAFTSHGYVPGGPTRPARILPSGQDLRAERAFGNKGGTMPHLAEHKPPARRPAHYAKSGK
jgi:hypothetical protein